MAKIRWTIAAALVAALAAASLPAHALPPTAGTNTDFPSVTRALTDGTGLDPVARASLAAFRQSPHAGELLAALERAQETLSAHFVWAEPVHDVSGDGGADVLTVDAYLELEISDDVLAPTFSYETRYVIRLLEGATSKLLWTKRATLQNGYLELVEAQTGPRGRNGFALLIADGAFGPVEQRRFVIRAITGGGKNLWSRSYESVIVNEFPVLSYVNVPVMLDVFDAVEGRTSEYLVGIGDMTWAVDGYVSDIGAVLVDGTGAETPHLGREVGVAGDVPLPWATRDLSGDGLDDYVFVNPHPQLAQGEEALELGGTVRGRVGADGALVWERGGFDFAETITVWVYSVKDLIGNPRGDLLLTAWADDWERMEKGTEWDLYLVDGASGGPRWKRLGSWPYVPGDVDGDGEDDVIARSVGSNSEWTSANMRLWAYGPSGKTLWEKTYRSRTDGPLECKGGCSSSMGTGFGSAGDLQPDGVEDSYVMHVISHDPGTTTHFRYLVDGRTGARSLVSGKDLFALGTSLDLRGADVARVRWIEGAVHVTAATSRDAGLWNSAVSLGLAAEPTRLELDVTSVRLDRDRCPDVVVAVASRQGQYVFALDGGDGSLLWGRTLDGVRADFRARPTADRNRAC